MKMIKTLTLTDLENRLRSLGVRISRKSAKKLIEQGLFQGGCWLISDEKDEDLILEKEFEAWVGAQAVDATMSDDIVAYLRMDKGVRA